MILSALFIIGSFGVACTVFRVACAVYTALKVSHLNKPICGCLTQIENKLVNNLLKMLKWKSPSWMLVFDIHYLVISIEHNCAHIEHISSETNKM